MSATIKIYRWVGVSTTSFASVALPGATVGAFDITTTNTRANANDLHSLADTAYPIQIPGSGGTNYSYWVNTRLGYAGDGTLGNQGTINNVRWYVSWVTGYGTMPYLATSCINFVVAQAKSYVQAIGNNTGAGHGPGISGDILNTTNYSMNGTAATNQLVTLPANIAKWDNLTVTTSWLHGAGFPDDRYGIGEYVSYPTGNLQQSPASTVTIPGPSYNGSCAHWYTFDQPMLIFGPYGFGADRGPGVTVTNSGTSVGLASNTLTGLNVSANFYSNGTVNPQFGAISCLNFTNLVVYQIEVLAGASAGGTLPVTFMWRYDET